MADRPALKKGQEIEVTPEMIKAGVPELLDYDPRYEPPEAAVERLFAAMMEAYKGA